MDSIEAMVEAVKAHAIKNYNRDGWDTIVECSEDSELAEEIRESGATTIAEAIECIGKGCKVHDDHRKDIQAEAF